MVFFSLFVISAVILGAGAMLAPAWPGREPRIGLSATLLLGIISGGAVWWAELFGWDTLIIDYLLFAIVSGVILGGTLARGGEDAGWPSRGDLIFFGVVALICMMPLFVLALPLGENAASDALITLAIRQDGGFTDLGPFYPQIGGFAPPAFHALAAYLSQQLHQQIPTIHMALGALLAFLCVWTVFDLGAEIKDKRLGYTMVISLLGSFGMLGLLWQSYYSQLMGILFAFAFITYALRYYRQHKWADMIAAGLMLGMVFYTSSTLFAICLLGYYLAIFFPRRVQKPAKKISEWSTPSRFGLWFGILFVCLLGTGVWAFKSLTYFNYIYGFVTDYSSLSDDILTFIPGTYSVGASILLGYVLWRLTKRLEIGRFAYFLMGLGLLASIGTGFYLCETLPQAAPENDMLAMRWIAENTPDDSLIMNYPRSNFRVQQDGRIFLSSRWLTPFAERETVFPAAHYCFNPCPYPDDVYDYWAEPMTAQYILYKYDVDYVVIPDGLEFSQEVEGLRLVFEQGGARVYEVIGEE